MTQHTNIETNKAVEESLNTFTLWSSGDVSTNDGLTAVSLLGVTGRGSKTIDAGKLTVGSSIRIKVAGEFSSSNVSDGTLILSLNGVAIHTLLEEFDVNRTDYYFEKEITLHVISIGASGTITIRGRSIIQGDSAYDASVIPFGLLASAGAAGVAAIDTTVANLIDLTFKWEQDQAADSITSESTIEVLY